MNSLTLFYKFVNSPRARVSVSAAACALGFVYSPCLSLFGLCVLPAYCLSLLSRMNETGISEPSIKLACLDREVAAFKDIVIALVYSGCLPLLVIYWLKCGQKI